MPQSRSIQLACPECHRKQFEVRVLKDEGIGSAKCLQCGRDYLLLDSEEHWFDVIQQQYPRASRCGCKGTGFKLQIDYGFRDDGDVYSVDVWSTCAACDKSRRLFSADIDYSPTKHLVDQPLTFCKNPQILYDLHELTLYAKRADIARIVHFLGDDLGCQFAASIRDKGEYGEYVARQLNLTEAEQAIVKETQTRNQFWWIYASPEPIKLLAKDFSTARRESAFWKRREIIRIGSPFYMVFGSISVRPSLLYYIHFSNEYVKNERVIAKSQKFRSITAKLVGWLQAEFVSWRGSDCFDNEKENLRAFGNQFRQKAEKMGRK